ncbi:hypothetical protein OIU78_027974 [Salix suchowensis]|nr:hypothetical protein OIU78_027974 [Salix suchowensis]
MDKNQQATGVNLQKGLSNHKPDTHEHATAVLDTKQATIGGSLNQPLSWADRVRVTDFDYQAYFGAYPSETSWKSAQNTS